MSSSESSVYIVRIAGLPAASIEAFGSDDLGQGLAKLYRVEAELAGARNLLTNVLHAAIRRASPADRRLLLAIKRSCFNGRSLDRFRASGDLQRVEWATGEAGQQVLLLEDRVAELEQGIRFLYERVLRREREELITHLNHDGLIRGISLASREVAGQLYRLHSTPFDQFGRRERRLEISLLRYITRAVLKLSPYSSLTRVALGTVQRDSRKEGLWLAPGPWRERSLFRLNRYLVEQYQRFL